MFCEFSAARWMARGKFCLSLLAKIQLIHVYGICAEILEQSTGAKNRVGIGLSYRPARLHRLSFNVYKYGLL